MASCELLRPPAEVSLKRLISSISIGGTDKHEEDRRCVVGAILERQVDSLAGSLWKPDVQSAVAGLLSDCVSTYDAETRPIRRAGVMLRHLELSYYTGGPNGDVQLEEYAKEIEALLSLEVHLFHLIIRILIIYLGYRTSDEILRLRICLPFIERKCTCGFPYINIAKCFLKNTRSSFNTLRMPVAFLGGGFMGLP